MKLFVVEKRCRGHDPRGGDFLPEQFRPCSCVQLLPAKLCFLLRLTRASFPRRLESYRVTPPSIPGSHAQQTNGMLQRLARISARKRNIEWEARSELQLRIDEKGLEIAVPRTSLRRTGPCASILGPFRIRTITEPRGNRARKRQPRRLHSWSDIGRQVRRKLQQRRRRLRHGIRSWIQLYASLWPGCGRSVLFCEHALLHQ